MNETAASRRPLALPGAAALVQLLCPACTVGPDYERPTTEAPASWAGVGPSAPESPADSVTTSGLADLKQWWEKFQDPKLTGLVQEALERNLDIGSAQARLRQAVAIRGVVAAGLWPSIDLSAAFQRTGTGNVQRNSLATGLSAAWTVDVFGGLRREVESADATVEAATASLRDVQVTLASEVALDYIQLRSYQEQIATSEESLKSQRHTADITQQRFAAGFVSRLDVANANAQVAVTMSIIPVLQTLVQQNIYALGVLLGRSPADLLDDLSKPSPVPLTPPEIPVGLPSDLLRRRPDIRVAEAQLHAATAQIGVAVSDFYPHFSLTTLLSFQSNVLGSLLATESRSWSAGAQASWNLFQGGGTLWNVRLQEARRDEVFLNYKKTVLTALQEVESALVAFAREWDHRKALADAVTYDSRALELSNQLYTEGATDFLNVLNAQRSLFAAQIALAQSRQSLAVDLVALYRALGGGWEDLDDGR